MKVLVYFTVCLFVCVCVCVCVVYYVVCNAKVFMSKVLPSTKLVLKLCECVCLCRVPAFVSLNLELHYKER